MTEIEKIRRALLRARKITKSNGGSILRSRQLSRSDRELLIQKRWLQEIVKGWYLLTRPDLAPGDSSAWYASFWDFLKIYLRFHFKEKYSLSAENSLDLLTGSTAIPPQVIVISAKGGGVPLKLPFDTSVFVYADSKNLPDEQTQIRGLQLMPLPLALARASPLYFQKNPINAEIALKLIHSSDEIVSVVANHNYKSAAARILGAYHHLKNKKMARELTTEFSSLGWKIQPDNPFKHPPYHLPQKIKSPYCSRIELLWSELREEIIPFFPKSYRKKGKRLEDLYERDAYNSLSIEGYEVDDELIARVQNDGWNPDLYLNDAREKDALAARGYYEAFLDVKKSIERLSTKQKPGSIIERDLKKWRASLFAPMHRAGILKSEDLIGYRRGQVYIRNSRHVPLPKESLIDAMETFFKCLKNEPYPAVRAILGHFIFVYIHPYMDGNGRLARFIMNLMFISGGYPWTIIRVKNRRAYLSALESASTERDIAPFAKFVAGEMQAH